MSEAGSLVWLRGVRGAYAQKWSADSVANARADKKYDKIVLAEHPLTKDEFALPINALIKKFAAPVERCDKTADMFALS